MRGLTCTRRLYKDTLLFTAHSSGKCVFKGFFPPEDTKHHLLPPVAASNTHTDTQMCCRCITLHYITLIALYAHTCVKHTKIIFSNIPKGIWDLNVDKRMEHNCVYFVCVVVVWWAYCSVICSWILGEVELQHLIISEPEHQQER